MGSSRTLLIPASLENLGRIRDFVQEAITGLGATASCTAEMQLAVDEAVTNVIVHGYQATSGDVEIEVRGDGATVVVDIRDHASHFVPAHDAGADLSISPLAQPVPGGYGLHLIRGMVDEAEYGVLDDGRNQLTLTKRCMAEPNSSTSAPKA